MNLRYLAKFDFNHWLAISLLLHLCLVSPLFLVNLHAPDQSRHEKLSLELFGMMSNRQIEERHAATEAPQQAKQTPRSPADRYLTTTTESPVHVAKTDESVPKSEPAQMSTPVVSAVEAVEQRQQSINQPDLEVIKRKYMARVAKRIQTNLVYPQEVREHGVEGITTIAFTITTSGDIQGGSLRVVKSSGYATLDSNALRSARNSAPFEEPPGEQNVVIDVSFER